MDNHNSSSSSDNHSDPGQDDFYMLHVGMLRLSLQTTEMPVTGSKEHESRTPKKGKGKVAWVHVRRRGRQRQESRARRRLFQTLADSPDSSPPRRVSQRQTSIARRRENVSAINPHRPLRRRLLDDFERYGEELSQAQISGSPTCTASHPSSSRPTNRNRDQHLNNMTEEGASSRPDMSSSASKERPRNRVVTWVRVRIRRRRQVPRDSDEDHRVRPFRSHSASPPTYSPVRQDVHRNRQPAPSRGRGNFSTGNRNRPVRRRLLVDVDVYTEELSDTDSMMATTPEQAGRWTEYDYDGPDTV